MPFSYRGALRVGLVYLLVSIAWLQLSNHLLFSFLDEPWELGRWLQVRGYVWVAFSALAIYLMCARFARASQLQQPLKENRERLRQAAAVFDCTREGVLVTDAQGLIVHVNRAFMAITGYSREDVMGQQPSLFKSGRHSSYFYQQMFQSLERTGN
jgi:PAS domain-containing protein